MSYYRYVMLCYVASLFEHVYWYTVMKRDGFKGCYFKSTLRCFNLTLSTGALAENSESLTLKKPDGTWVTFALFVVFVIKNFASGHLSGRTTHHIRIITGPLNVARLDSHCTETIPQHYQCCAPMNQKSNVLTTVLWVNVLPNSLNEIKYPNEPVANSVWETIA